MVSYNIKKFALTFYKWRKINENQIFIDIMNLFQTMLLEIIAKPEYILFVTKVNLYVSLLQLLPDSST